MQNVDLSKLIQIKLDWSLVQDPLTLTIQDIYSKISKIQSLTEKQVKQHEQIHTELQQLHELVGQSNHNHEQAIKELQQKINNYNAAQQTNIVVEKTPKQVLDHIQNRLQLNLNTNGGVKEIDVNCSPPKTDRVIKTFRVKQNTGVLEEKELLDQKVYEFYERTVQKIESQLTELRRDFRNQMSQLSVKTVKKADNQPIQNSKITQNNQKKILNTKKDNKDKYQKQKNTKPRTKQSQDIDMGDFFGGDEDPSQHNISQNKSQKNVTISKKRIQSTPFQTDPVYSSADIEQEGGEEEISPLQKMEIKEFLDELKKEVKAQLVEVVKNAEQKFEEINRTNSVIADHLVEAKKSMEQLINDKDTIKIQLAGMREKGSTSERQICLLLDSSTENKNRIKTLENSLNKINEDLKSYKPANEVIREESNQDDRTDSKKDLFRDSHSSFRSSIAGNLNPIRNNSILKLNNNKMQGIQDSIKLINTRVGSLIDRVNRMEDEKKKWDLQQFGSSLPKIDKQNKSNVNPIEIIKKQLKKVNDDIIKTNEKLNATKDKLNELYESHAEIPNKIQDIYIKLRQNNELQEDRLIELIKELINRALTDPFDNNFTNRLKRQINVKFLEIKHEYNCILKDIQSKVQNRAEISQLQKVVQKFQESVLEVKSIASKKCETQDFKKGIKYLEGKIKQVFQFAKTETGVLANQQRQYIGAKKQQLH